MSARFSKTASHDAPPERVTSLRPGRYARNQRRARLAPGVVSLAITPGADATGLAVGFSRSAPGPATRRAPLCVSTNIVTPNRMTSPARRVQHIPAPLPGVLMKSLVLTLAIFIVPAHGLAAEPKSRTFKFTYEATVIGLKPEQTARVWLPLPQTSDDQRVTDMRTTFSTEARTETESRFGNKMLYLVPKAGKDGEIPLRVVYTIERKEVRGETDKALMDDLERFLKPDPLTKENGKHLKLIEGKKLPEDAMEVGKEFYELVNGMMKYSKDGTLWGRGDVDWVCDSRFGNCTDFHSLYLALMRSQKIPGKFEIGFGIPEKRGAGDVAGYHCWAKFKLPNRGWAPVDISEANKNPKLKDYYFGNLTEDRVTFTVGRDLTLSPKQDGPALNFFVYPYVEVDGKPYPADKVKRKFSYEDVDK